MNCHYKIKTILFFRNRQINEYIERGAKYGNKADVAILNFREGLFCEGLFANHRPIANDVRLLVKSDTSLNYDRDVKGPIYAVAGSGDYRNINRNNRTAEVYRDPQADGRFATVLTAKSGETLVPLAMNRISRSVDELLGPAQK